jgi:hypothetical protein
VNLPNRYLTDAILAAVIILVPTIAAGIAFDTKSGSIADWVAAIATGGALIAAIYAGQQAAQIVNVERRRDDQLEANQRRAQAEQIAAWGSGISTYLTNASELPVYDVQLNFTIGKQATGLCIALLVPTQRIPNPTQFAVVQEAWNRATSARIHGVPEPRTRVSIAFTDAAGVRWERDFQGRLRELTRSDTPATPPTSEGPDAPGRLLV